MTVAPPIPARLAVRPRDDHGRVIAYTLGVRDGEPLMGTNDAEKTAECIRNRLCGLCGEPLDYWIAFIGDAVTVSRRVFIEPPAHEECARYAMAVCPYLLASAGFEICRQRPGVLVVADRSRPEQMALYITRGYKPFYGTEMPSAKADAPARLEWF